MAGYDGRTAMAPYNGGHGLVAGRPDWLWVPEPQGGGRPPSGQLRPLREPPPPPSAFAAEWALSSHTMMFGEMLSAQVRKRERLPSLAILRRSAKDG